MAVTTPFLVEQFLLGAKTEASYGTRATLVATNYVYVNSVDLKIDSKNVARDYRHAQLNTLADAQGDTLYNITIEGEYRVSGSGKSVDPIDTLEQAAGLYPSSSATPDITYFLTHSADTGFPCPGKSATIVAYYRNQLYTLLGVYGNMVETHNSDGLVKYKFTGKGIYSASVEIAQPSPTFNGTYVKVASASFTAQGYTPEWSSFEIDYGNTVEVIPYAGDQYGYSKVLITKRDPTVKFNPLMDSKATHDYVGKMIDKSEQGFKYNTNGTAGSRLEYSGSCQYRQVDIKDENGVYRYDVVANLVGQYTKRIY